MQRVFREESGRIIALRHRLKENREANVIVDAALGVVEASDPVAAAAVAAYRTVTICWKATKAYEKTYGVTHDRDLALKAAEKTVVKETGKEIGEEMLGSIVDFSMIEGIDDEVETIMRELAASIGGETLDGMEKCGKELKGLDESMKAAFKRLTITFLFHAMKHDPEAKAHFDRLPLSKRKEIEDEVGTRADAVASSMWRKIENRGFHEAVASADNLGSLFREALREPVSSRPK